MTTIIIEDGSPQAKEFVVSAHKLVIVKSYPLVLSSDVAKKDWMEIVNKQLIIHHSTQPVKKRILTEKYAYLRVVRKRAKVQRDTEVEN